MKDIITGIKEIAKNDHKVLIGIILVLLSSSVFIVMSLTNVKPSNLQVVFRYASLGENYYNSAWYYLYTFPFLGVVLGLLHNLLTVKVYTKKGSTVALWFVGSGIILLLLTVITMSKILGLQGVI
jgi:hypothetical protein